MRCRAPGTKHSAYLVSHGKLTIVARQCNSWELQGAKLDVAKRCVDIA